jgi:hypothetical protein
MQSICRPLKSDRPEYQDNHPATFDGVDNRLGIVALGIDVARRNPAADIGGQAPRRRVLEEVSP